MLMKKQFFRVKQLADQTFLRAEKSEVLNNEELQIADQKVEYLHKAIQAISKRIPSASQGTDADKRIKKNAEYYLANVFTEQGNKKGEPGGVSHEPCHLFQDILRRCGDVESALAKEYADHELQVETWVGKHFQALLENEFPNVLKQKRNLSKYILDKDSASNRYHSTKKEALKDDMEEADSKVEQNRDALAYEMFGLLARENEFSSLILQYLKLQRGYHESALKILEDVIPELEKKIGDSSIRPVFGVSLQEHLRVTGKRIASPLEICITVLQKIGMSEEGLFRIAGSSSRVKRLKSAIDSACLTDLIGEYQDVHVLASTLKMYLRELPEPLLTYELHDEWIRSMNDNHKLEAVKRLIAKLPPENRDNLSFLIQFLAKLSRHPENKMNSSNIAIVLAPNLLWDKDKEMNMITCAIINMLVELFIKEVDELFPHDLSEFVSCPFAISQDDEGNTSTGSVQASNLREADFNVSSESIQISDSPRPNSRKKKPAAPVPPNSVMSKTDQDIHQGSEKVAPYLSGSSTLNRVPKSKDNARAKASVAINTEENSLSLSRRKSFSSSHEDTHKPLVSLDNVEALPASTMTTPTKPVPSVAAQQSPANCDNKSFKTTATHQVLHQEGEKSPKPVAAPRSLDQIDRSAVSRSSSMRSDVMSKSATEIGEVQFRRPEVASKPEVPARPASLQKQRASNETALDQLHKTQCSVYSTANKQQASFVNLHRPGHDNLISEKEKFLGHQPTTEKVVTPMPRASLENKFGDINSNCSSRPGLPPKKLTKSTEKLDVTKSSEKLNDPTTTAEKFNGNGNQRPSHVRTRSDGNIIDFGGDHSTLLQTPPSPRSLNKPTQPPPPPPVNVNKVNKPNPDSTDL